MKLFISWSGKRSMSVAAALRNWLKMILQAIEPWMSEIDLKAGQRWTPELEGELSKAVFGISCVTPKNRNAPWLLFEAGALATQVKDKAFLCPYLIDLDKSDLDYPLAQFQAKKWDRDGTLGLVRGINSAIQETEPKSAVSEAILEDLFKALWPKLEKDYADAPVEEQQDEPEKRDPTEVALENLEQTRELSRQLVRLEQKVQSLNLRNQLYIRPSGMFGSVPFLDQPGNLLTNVLPFAGTAVPPVPLSEEAQRFLDHYVASVAKQSNRGAGPQCPKCGETENFRTSTQDFTGKIDHHDLVCEKCGTIADQFHTFRADEKQKHWACRKDCPHRLEQTPGQDKSTT